MVLTIFLLLLSVTTLVKPEMFTALVHMEKSIHAEKRLAKEIRSYVTKERERLNELERIANEYESHAESAIEDMHATLANPVSAFLLVKRFTTDWNDVLNKYMTPNNTNQFIASLPQFTEGFPSPEDLDGAAIALLRLQDTYVLPTNKVAKGEIKGVRYSPKMTAQDCFQLGKVAYSQGDYYHTILWMKEALTLLENETPKTMEKPIILDYLAYSTYMQGNLIHALNLTKEWLEEEPGHVRAQSNRDYYSKLIREAKENGKKDEELEVFNNPRQLDDYRKTEEFATYEALCRGEETQVYPLAHKLTCQYKKHHPYYILRPLKEEIMYFDPWIAIYHDLMTESEVKRIQEMAGPRLHRSGVFVTEDNKSPISTYRTSQSAWLADSEDQLIRKFSGKIHLMSNLTLPTAEDLQVVNYGIGGHYEPHFDFARKREVNTFESWRGNRIATVIFYMTDVEAGGVTAFPNLGVKLYPEARSCAVWYNLMKSTEGDYRTRHAGCPVLTGSKWVANKWIHERGQEFTRPCTLKPEE